MASIARLLTTIFVAGVTWAPLTGCSRLNVNMYHDELADRPNVTTASVQQFRAIETQPSDRCRPHEAARVAALDDSVEHGPLYFADSPIDLEEQDDRFEWTALDLVYGYYAGGRGIVNSTFFPISAIVYPPWQVWESNGRASRTAWWHEVDDRRSSD